MRLSPETVYSCGFRAFSIFVVGGAATLFSCQRHSRPSGKSKRLQICTPLYINKVKIEESLKSIPIPGCFLTIPFSFSRVVRQLDVFVPHDLLAFCHKANRVFFASRKVIVQ